jgi:hypothetical protein
VIASQVITSNVKNGVILQAYMFSIGAFIFACGITSTIIIYLNRKEHKKEGEFVEEFRQRVEHVTKI